MTVVVMSEPLRQKQASAYLWARPEHERKVVVTRDPQVDVSQFPPGTEILTWGSGAGIFPRGLASRLTDRAKGFVRGGSPTAAVVARWLKSAEWRLRYLDRFQALVHSGAASQGIESRLELVQLLEDIASGHEGSIAVLDLFDLPAVLRLDTSGSMDVLVL